MNGINDNSDVELLDSIATVIYDRIYIYLAGQSHPPLVLALGFQNCTKPRPVFFRFSEQLNRTARAVMDIWRKRNDNCPHLNCEWDPMLLSSKFPQDMSPTDVHQLELATNPVGPWTVFKDPILIPSWLQPKHTLGVCVGPVYLYGDWIQMVQFLEIWRAMGATQFWIYTSSLTEMVDRWLKAYEEEGLVQRVPWPLLPRSPKTDQNPSVYVMGQFACLNDCARRTAHRAKFVALVDFDEFIIPRDSQNQSPTLVEFLDEQAKIHPNVGNFIFRQAGRALYPRSYSIPKMVETDNFKFDYLTKVMVENEENMGHNKSVFRPEQVWYATTHRVKSFLNKQYEIVSVEPSDGHLVHLKRGEKARIGHSTEPIKEFPRLLQNMNWNFAEIAEKHFGPSSNLSSQTEVLQQAHACGLKEHGKGMDVCKAPHHLCAGLLEDSSLRWIVYTGSEAGINKFTPIH